MEDLFWIQMGVAVIAGGACGAVITATVTTYRNRIQPVGCKVHSNQMFSEIDGPSALKVKVSVTDSGNSYSFDNLHERSICITNKGNKDFPEFPFGLSLPDGHSAILMETGSPDRHHTFSSAPSVSPSSPLHDIDFELKPFNRGDRYTIVLYVNVDSGKEESGEIKFSTPSPVYFTQMNSTSDIISQITSGSKLFGIGPLEIIINAGVRGIGR